MPHGEKGQGFRIHRIPRTIKSRRITLRPFVNSDFPALHELYSDSECTKFTFRRVLSEGESWRAMSSMAGHWLLRGYGPYAVVETTSTSVLGVCGLWYPADWPEPEIKWALRRRYWGQGFASEAVRAVQAMCAKSWRDAAPISLIDADNARSIQVALAVGAAFERAIEFRGSPWMIYRHPASARRSSAG